MTNRKQHERPDPVRLVEAAWIAAVTVLCVWVVVSTLTQPLPREATRETTTPPPGIGTLVR
jgi:hypothetical protein